MKLFVTILKALLNLIFLPVSAAVDCRKKIKRDLSKPAANEISYRRGVYKHWLGSYIVVTGIWTIVAYFGWSYVVTTESFWYLVWIAQVIQHTLLFDLNRGYIYGSGLAFALMGAVYLRHMWNSLSHERDVYKRESESANQKLNDVSLRYHHILAGLKVIGERGLTIKARKQSAAARAVGAEIDSLLDLYPQEVKSKSVFDLIKSWEHTFAQRDRNQNSA